ncbi:dihydropteroate synthase [Maritimibacter sp. 55A14]|uniref:dihydropteroate synthase n=1 Tax=Maritimibacter sp. 55A14 TaxID=2174844 RepID=UPI000D617569|nr:dihydropteroate synthase [Maritimibacter sp. 55A14]PWE33670.1 dihydropteroate synthase [Maritimibacter sp. 55A14]
MSKTYHRPLAQCGPDRPRSALSLAGGWAWFTHVERIVRGGPREVVPVRELSLSLRQRLTTPRLPLAGLALDRPRLMGVLNVTPDSFSDGGAFSDTETAIAHGRKLLAAGADILDIGGESTRPGAAEVPGPEEIARTAPVIEAIREADPDALLSIDTRKADVAEAALGAGAVMLNDVSAMTYDPRMAEVAAVHEGPLCLMHAQGDPATMQKSPRYDDVLLDVYDFLEARVAAAEAAGVPRARLVVDPGIGFGKTLEHNLALIRGIGLFHMLGCALLLGVSRKRFIGTIGGEPDAARRAPGSIAVALEAIRQGVQITRVHDMAETRQAVALWQAVNAIE